MNTEYNLIITRTETEAHILSTNKVSSIKSLKILQTMLLAKFTIKAGFTITAFKYKSQTLVMPRGTY